MRLKVEVKEGHPIPERSNSNDTGIDISVLSIEKKDDFYLCDMGIKLDIDYGFYCEILARSSLIKHGFILSNGAGVIDTDYKKDIFVPLIYVGKLWGPDCADKLIGKRIAQIIVKRVEVVELEIVDKLEPSYRGGFGSTGL